MNTEQYPFTQPTTEHNHLEDQAHPDVLEPDHAELHPTITDAQHGQKVVSRDVLVARIIDARIEVNDLTDQFKSAHWEVDDIEQEYAYIGLQNLAGNPTLKAKYEGLKTLRLQLVDKIKKAKLKLAGLESDLIEYDEDPMNFK